MHHCASMRWLLHTSTYMRAQGTLGQYACQKVPCMYVVQMALEFLNMYMWCCCYEINKNTHVKEKKVNASDGYFRQCLLKYVMTISQHFWII